MRRLRAVCGLVAALAGLVTGCSAARGPAEAAPGAAGGRWNVLPAGGGDSGAAFAGARVGELTQVVVAFPAKYQRYAGAAAVGAADERPAGNLPSRHCRLPGSWPA
jgi:hypothetical protein